MAGFLYYFPELTIKPAAPELVKLGLGYLTEGQLNGCGCRAGPEGRSGITCGLSNLAPDARQPTIAYLPDLQTWLPQPAGAKEPIWYLGWVNDDPPQPRDLARPKMLGGHEVRLRDGFNYLIPAIRFLPRIINYVNGQIVRRPTAEFAHLEDLINRCWSDFERDNMWTEDEPAVPERLTEVEQYELMLHLLRVNYYLGAAELNTRQLIDDYGQAEILQAGMDIPTLKKMTEAAKKKRG